MNDDLKWFALMMAALFLAIAFMSAASSWRDVQLAKIESQKGAE